MAERYGPETTVPDWHERLVCSRCDSRRVDMVVSDLTPTPDCRGLSPRVFMHERGKRIGELINGVFTTIIV
jgi:hypothetical protein